MFIELSDLVLVLILAVVIYWCWRAYAVKEMVLSIVRKHCKEMGVQLLDDSVVLRGIWLKRDAHHALRVRRSYEFEFTSTGDERYQGSAVVLGLRLEAIQLEAHRLN